MKRFIEKTTIKFLIAKENFIKHAKMLVNKQLKGEAFLDVLIKIIIIVVIGGLLLGVLYLMFKDTLLPKIQNTILQMFDFKG